MLKACCDCISAGIQERNDVYGAETIHLNGTNTTAPSCPQSIRTNMFLLPKILEEGDRINTTWLLANNSKWVSISLLTGQNGANGIEPDYNNIASQIYIPIASADVAGSEYIQLKTYDNGTESNFTTSYTSADLIPVLDPSENSIVNVEFTLMKINGNYAVNHYLGPSFLGEIFLKHDYNSIRYISFNGDVGKVKGLYFDFA